MRRNEKSELPGPVFFNTLIPPSRHFAPRPALRFAHRRILVITSNAFYFFTPDMEKAMMKSSNALNCLLGLSLSSYADGYAILHFTDHDYVINSRRKAAIVMVLKERYTTLLESELPLDFSDRIEYKTWGGGMFRSKAIVMNFVTFKEDSVLPPNTVDFSMSRSEQNTMEIRVPSNLASKAPIGLNDSMGGGGGGGGGGYTSPTAYTPAPSVINNYAKPSYGGTNGGASSGPPKNPYSSYVQKDTVAKTPAFTAPAASQPHQSSSPSSSAPSYQNNPGVRTSLTRSVPKVRRRQRAKAVSCLIMLFTIS